MAHEIDREMTAAEEIEVYAEKRLLELKMLLANKVLTNTTGQHDRGISLVSGECHAFADMLQLLKQIKERKDGREDSQNHCDSGETERGKR